MLDIFHGLRLVVKRRSISIDNAIFRCHWFFTSTLLVSFSVIITARQYVGQPIECHSMNKIPNSLLNSYCWVQSTFTVPQACNRQIGLDVPYPCIDNTRGREIKVYAYYQWVGMVLFVQGLLFHLPYYLWKVWENGLISAITSGLRVAVLSDQERTKKREIVVEYMYEHLGCHRRYAYKYFLCEFICLLNLAGQIWSVNRFFDGQFLSYGLDVIQYSASNHRNYPASAHANVAETSQQFPSSSQQQSNNNNNQEIKQHISLANNDNIPSNSPYQHQISPLTIGHHFDNQSASSLKVQNLLSLHRANNRQLAPIDPMSFVFPRITKCTYYDFGSSGDVQKHDAICLLPLNIINEKIYIALWFWFFLLAILTLVVVIFRIFAIISPTVRCRGLLSRCKLANEQHVRLIIEFCDVGDWFLFYMVAENVDPIVMREIVASLADKLARYHEMKKNFGLGDGDKLLDVPPELEESMAATGVGLLNDDVDDSDPSSRTAMDEPPDGAAPGSNVASSRHVRYNEHDPRQWRSTTQEPEQQQQQHQANQHHQQNHHYNHHHHHQQQQHESLLMEAGQCSSSNLRPMSRTIAQANECLPLPRQPKFKKRLYSKRLWSMDLGPGDFRRQLLFGERPRVPAETLFQPSNAQAMASSSTSIFESPGAPAQPSSTAPPGQQHGPAPPTFRFQVSAPPDSQLSGLDAAPPLLLGSHRHLSTPSESSSSSSSGSSGGEGNSNLYRRRRASPHAAAATSRSQLLSPTLSRSHSGVNSASGSNNSTTQSACDSFVLEMQPFHGDGSRLVSPSPSAQYENELQRRHQLQRRSSKQHAHHQSISSMRDIDWNLHRDS